MVGCTPDWLGVSRGSEVGAAAVSRSPVVDEAPLVAVRADGDVFASQQIVREPSEGALALSSTRSWPSLRCTSAAARFSSSCETLVAPSSGMTLPRRAASHARAACAGVHLPTTTSWWRSDARTGLPVGEPSSCARSSATRSSPARTPTRMRCCARTALTRSQLNADNAHYVKLTMSDPSPAVPRGCCSPTGPVANCRPLDSAMAVSAVMKARADEPPAFSRNCSSPRQLSVPLGIGEVVNAVAVAGVAVVLLRILQGDPQESSPDRGRDGLTARKAPGRSGLPRTWLTRVRWAAWRVRTAARERPGLTGGRPPRGRPGLVGIHR